MCPDQRSRGWFIWPFRFIWRSMSSMRCCGTIYLDRSRRWSRRLQRTPSPRLCPRGTDRIHCVTSMTIGGMTAAGLCASPLSIVCVCFSSHDVFHMYSRWISGQRLFFLLFPQESGPPRRQPIRRHRLPRLGWGLSGGGGKRKRHTPRERERGECGERSTWCGQGNRDKNE